MRRREVLGILAGAAMGPLAARAQGEAPRHIDYIYAAVADDDVLYEGRLAAFRDALHGLGWIEGRNLKLNIRRMPPSGADISKHISEWLAERPDVIVGGGGTTMGPLMRATSSVPIVFATAIDPVGAGFVESLAHPGGNVTGFMQFDYSLSGKWLELLRQVSPSVARVGVIRDATTTSGIGQFAVIQAAAAPIGVDIVSINAHDDSEIERGIGKVARSANGGLIGVAGAAVGGRRDLIIQLAAQHRLPTVYANRTYVDRGGLISYGADQIASSRLAAGYVDRILKGEKPEDLPVQAPNKYDLVVNLKTAKALGLDIPASVIARADEVIE